MFKRISFVIAILIFIVVVMFSQTSYSINILSVQDPDQYGSRYAYIDEATLVVEPHGGYVEESLYLKYSDHEAYPGRENLEIVHRFELPQGSVVNDLWLWIGDSVMQAIMLDTWTARAIYDSIVANKRDPAFLAKTGNQYELHIYPLESGSFRKVKINFITPTKWTGENAIAPLPFEMLNSNNAATKPLDILFRTREEIWGRAGLLEDSEAGFEYFEDAKGYHYKKLTLPDISSFSSLNLTFETQFTDGYFYRNYKTGNGPAYFQLGLAPRSFFNIRPDSTAKKYFVGLDLSGMYRRDIPEMLQNVQNVLTGALKINDQFRFAAVANDESYNSLSEWMEASPQTVNAVFDEFSQSEFAQKLVAFRKKHIIYCDSHAATCWRIEGIENLASYKNYSNIQSAIESFQYADIIAAYDHGNELPLSNDELVTVRQSLTPFFNKGGRLLSYYDYNRTGKEKLASSFIPGLGHVKRAGRDLYRNENGNIGAYFPNYVVANVAFALSYEDESVKVELMDSEGLPVVISKKIDNGLLIVSGIWSFEDDAALRSQLAIPLLGLNEAGSRSQLLDLLVEAADVQNEESFDKAIVFSNSDSLISQDEAAVWVNDFKDQFSAATPEFHTINLLDGLTFTPPYTTIDGADYFGSGALLKELSDVTGGLHFETHEDDWPVIEGSLSPWRIDKREVLEVGVDIDNSAGELVEMREVQANPNDGGKPIFFLGEFNGEETISFSFSAKFKNDEQPHSNDFVVDVAHDSSASAEIIPTMLAFEHLQDMFVLAAYDTASIVELALKHNLLCDYTSLLALEPNEQRRFMPNPFDESELTLVLNERDVEQDSFDVDLYPNPFNEKISISIDLYNASHMSVVIYNLRGQVVTELMDETTPAGKRIVHWNSTDVNGKRVSSGIYFVRIKVENYANKYVGTNLQRILLVR